MPKPGRHMEIQQDNMLQLQLLPLLYSYLGIWIPGSPKLFTNQIVSYPPSPYGYLLKASKLSTKATHSISIKFFPSFPNKTCFKKYKSVNFITSSSSNSFFSLFFFFFFLPLLKKEKLSPTHHYVPCFLL